MSLGFPPCLIEIRPVVRELKHADTSTGHRSRNIVTDCCLWEHILHCITSGCCFLITFSRVCLPCFKPKKWNRENKPMPSHFLHVAGLTGSLLTNNTSNRQLPALCTVRFLRLGRSQQNAQWIWSSPLTDVRIIGCVWVTKRPYLHSFIPTPTLQLKPLSRKLLTQYYS
jgi:hypothetical protein